MLFTDLGFSPTLLPLFMRALQSKGLTVPTAVQQAAIPAVLTGRDLLCSAPTGSGKTVAYALPLLQQLSERPARLAGKCQALVLVPTRELAVQVGETLVTFAKVLPQRIKATVVFGGVSINPQMMHLRGGADVVVATPGRLLDLIDRNALSLSQVKTLVLDEADKLLDLGFADELERIVELLPKLRQNALFSATFTPGMEALATRLLQTPVLIKVQPQGEALPQITQRAVEVDAPRRTQLLRHLIQTDKLSRVLVFVATKHAAEMVADKLRKASINAEPFHGELSQGKRSQVLMDFKANAVQVVVATDVAARGLDITGLPVVVNYDLPRSAVDYTHRIGRTGRAGLAGVAISFVSADTNTHWRLIEKRQAVTVAREQVAGFEPLNQCAESTVGPLQTGGVKGKRPNKKDKLRAVLS